MLKQKFSLGEMALFPMFWKKKLKKIWKKIKKNLKKNVKKKKKLKIFFLDFFQFFFQKMGKSALSPNENFCFNIFPT